MNRYFIHEGGMNKLTELAGKGGGFKETEVMVLTGDFKRIEPDPEVRKSWIEIKFMTYGG